MSRASSAADARERPTYTIESVDNALRLLHMFFVMDRIRITEAAAELRVSPSTAHRLMSMLQYHGFATQDRRTHEYLPGPDLIRFGFTAAKQLDLREQARPILEKLMKSVNETVHLGMLHASNVLYLDSVEGTRLLRIGARAGNSVPLHCVAMGKALLATISPARFNELYPRERLTTMTARTIRTKTVLAKQLAIVRKRGFAHSLGESEDGIASIAAAVPDDDSLVPTAISIAAPATRANRDRINEWLPHLIEAVQDLRRLC